MNNEELLFYLAFGYIPGAATLPISLPDQKNELDDLENIPLKELIKCGGTVWKNAIEATLAESSRQIVIPLSGGLDSRAILAGILEFKAPKEIFTYTFGVPGALDYEIGNLIAKVAGTEHSTFDLRHYEYNIDNLMDIAERVQGRNSLFYHAPVSLIQKGFGNDVEYWSGYLGGELAGSHVRDFDNITWENAKKFFVQWNISIASRNIILIPENAHIELLLPDHPIITSRIFTYDDQLDFAIKQQYYAKPLVLLNGFVYKTPFLYQGWIDFMLSTPRRLRKDKYLFKQILLNSYPDLFSYPTKNNAGLSLKTNQWIKNYHTNMNRMISAARRLLPRFNWGTPPNTNYIDFNHGLRERFDLRNVVYESLQDLKKRGVVDWINIDDIWRRHQFQQGNYSDSLMLLASLELCLKFNENPGIDHD